MERLVGSAGVGIGPLPQMLGAGIPSETVHAPGSNLSPTHDNLANPRHHIKLFQMSDTRSVERKISNKNVLLANVGER
jgi:hypothetical protein